MGDINKGLGGRRRKIALVDTMYVHMYVSLLLQFVFLEECGTGSKLGWRAGWRLVCTNYPVYHDYCEVQYVPARSQSIPDYHLLAWYGRSGLPRPRTDIFCGPRRGGAWGQSIAIVMEGIPQVHNKVEIDEKTWKRDDDKSVGATATERYVYLVLTYFSTYCYRLTHD